MEKLEKSRQVIHLHFPATDKHYYFGSISAMCENFSRQELQVAAQTLYNSWKNEIYVTDTAVIRRGRLIQKKQKKSKNS